MDLKRVKKRFPHCEWVNNLERKTWNFTKSKKESTANKQLLAVKVKEVMHMGGGSKIEKCWLTFGDGWEASFWDSRSRWLRRVDGDMEVGEVGLRNLSKIAMTKNMEMRIAVATKPKETAFTELSKLLQCSSLCGDSVGVGGHPLLCSSTAIDK